MGLAVLVLFCCASLLTMSIGPGQPAVYRPGEAGGRRVRQGTGYPGGGSCYFGPEVKSALVKGQISLVERLRWQGLPADG